MMSFNVLVKFLLSFVLFVRLCQCHGLTLLPPEVLDWEEVGVIFVSFVSFSCHTRVTVQDSRVARIPLAYFSMYTHLTYLCQYVYPAVILDSRVTLGTDAALTQSSCHTTV